MVKEKKLYLCNGCKLTGVRSYRSKVFENFFCHRCKKISTLFLPVKDPPKQPTPDLSDNHEEDMAITPQAPPEIPVPHVPPHEPFQVTIVNEKEKALFSIRDVFIFMAGLIVGLLIIKTTSGR